MPFKGRIDAVHCPTRRCMALMHPDTCPSISLDSRSWPAPARHQPLLLWPILSLPLPSAETKILNIWLVSSRLVDAWAGSCRQCMSLAVFVLSTYENNGRFFMFCPPPIILRGIILAMNAFIFTSRVSKWILKGKMQEKKGFSSVVLFCIVSSTEQLPRASAPSSPGHAVILTDSGRIRDRTMYMNPALSIDRLVLCQSLEIPTSVSDRK
ncbi:hypothetical protein V1507DRAFT_281681 [Lipomyces tetrasporus]